MRLGFDIDGVLTDLPGRMVQVAREKFGVVITPLDIYQADALAQLGLGPDELTEMFQPAFFYDMEPMVENIKATQQLVEDGHEIHVVTARPESDEMFDATIEWFKKHGIPEVDSFTFHHNKALVALHLKLRRFVEDFSSNANDLAQVMGEVYLVNQPYNLNDKLESNVVRVNDVWEVYDRLHGEKLKSAA